MLAGYMVTPAFAKDHPSIVSGKGPICGQRTHNWQPSARALQASSKEKHWQKPHLIHSPQYEGRCLLTVQKKKERKSQHLELLQLQGGKQQEEFVQAEEMQRWKCIAHLEFVLSASNGFLNGENTSPSCSTEAEIIHYKHKNDTQHNIRCWATQIENYLLNYAFSSLEPCSFLGVFHWISSRARTVTETVNVKWIVENICWKHLLNLETRIDALENQLWVCKCTLRCPCAALLIF